MLVVLPLDPCAHENGCRMSIVIGVAALKGGVGKSTIAIHLSSYLHTQGRKVLLIDGDAQGSCRQWSAVAAGADRNTPLVVSMGPEMRRDITRVSVGYDFVIIDTPARLGVEQRAAMSVSDLVMIPVTPGPQDVWALAETLSVLDEVLIIRPGLRASVVLNRMSARTSLAAVTKQAIEKHGVPLLPGLGARVAYAEAIASGQGITTYARDSVAAAEIEQLAKATLNMMENRHGEERTSRDAGAGKASGRRSQGSATGGRSAQTTRAGGENDSVCSSRPRGESEAPMH